MNEHKSILRRLRPLTPLALFATLALGMGFAWFWWGTEWAATFANKLTTEGRDLERLGQLGDIFGGVNALFASLAFAAVAFAAYFQHETWRLAERQHALLTFEPLFFELLKLHRETANALTFRLHEAARTRWSMLPGVSMFRASPAPLSEFVNIMRKVILGMTNFGGKDGGLAQIQAIYEIVHKDNEDALGPYFRSLYHLFKLVDRSALQHDDKIRYAHIARATLGADQLFFLALNCLTSHGADFKPLIEKYGLLKHASNSLRLDRDIISRNYSPTALQSEAERESYWEDHPTERPQ